MRRLTPETLLYILAFLLALGLRFLQLGAAPLTEAEAGWALQALAAARGEEPVIGPQPAYVFLTSGAFAVLGSSAATARLWPALSGSLLVLAPAAFRRQLGRIPALILAFGLAIDPGLVAVSRIAGGPMMALAFGLLALALLRAGRTIPAGISAGVAVLSGPSILYGALSIGLAWLILRSFRVPSPWLGTEQTGSALDNPAGSRSALLSAGAAILLVGTLFLRFPQGLAAGFGALPAYLQGWAEPSGVPAARLVAALFVYEPLALIFALVAFVRLWMTASTATTDDSSALRSLRLGMFLLAWALAALLLALLYPARQVADLIWVIVPLWVLSAQELAHHLPDFLAERSEARLVSLGQAALTFILLALFWYTLAALSNTQPGSSSMLRFGVMAGVLALGALTTILVGLGWSTQVARDGLVWGVTAGLLVYQISTLWSATQLRPQHPVELWATQPATGQSALLVETLEALSENRTGFPRSIDVVSSVDSASMRWTLRNFTAARFEAEPAIGENPAVVITPQAEENPSLASAYRGQDFVWWTSPGWAGALPADVASWLTFRDAPVQEDRVILWARSDLFPGGEQVPDSLD